MIEINSTKAEWRSTDTRGAVGRPLWESPTLERYPGYEPLLREAVATAARGETFADQIKFEAPGQPTAHLDLTMQPVRGADGAIRYLLFEVRDITELKSAQEQLRQSQKMEALGQLTGGIAHDFNNLLTVVVGGLDLITKRTDDAKIRRYADNALSAAERGARLTAQLLAFSRVQRLEVRPTYVAPLIEKMRPLLRNVLGPGIEKSFDLDEELIPVMADPTQLELAVLNLAINARDAMPDGGTLFFETRKESVDGDAELEDGDYIALAIRDTGTGMTPDVIARAFEPFFTTKEVGKGTGLGLSMVYGVARQSGGTARIDSEPGKGTTVTLYFRHAEGVDPGAEAEGAAGEARPGAAASASILVIDDDPDVREFIAASLAESGYVVREAADGVAGIAEFREEAARPGRASISSCPACRARRSPIACSRDATRPADPVRVGVQRNRRDPPAGARHAASVQAVPRRRARRRGAQRAGDYPDGQFRVARSRGGGGLLRRSAGAQAARSSASTRSSVRTARSSPASTC